MESLQDGVTAAEFLAGQRQLELEAREVMPYEPDTCTYPNSLRQLVFACLTCQKTGQSVGVCYLCLIQCHSTHELVELFSKRGFVCDCGTERMKGPACSIRESTLGPQKKGLGGLKMRTGSAGDESRPRKLERGPAEDIPSLENTYNQNFGGRFCDCEILYDPEKETQTMHQCFFGEACGEDWYHEECIVETGKAQVRVKEEESEEPELGGLKEEQHRAPTENLDGKPTKNVNAEPTNLQEEQTEATNVKEIEAHSTDQALDAKSVQALSQKGFTEFVCWKCVALYSQAFEELCEHPAIAARLIHKALTKTPLDLEPPKKKQRSELYSVFLHHGFRPQLATLSGRLPESSLKKLLQNFQFFHKEDPVYEPPEDDLVSNGSESSLYDLGSNALLSLPVPQALEGLQAYDVMKEKLRGFFKGFVDQNKVVTEKEVREFFGKMQEERK